MLKRIAIGLMIVAWAGAPALASPSSSFETRHECFENAKRSVVLIFANDGISELSKSRLLGTGFVVSLPCEKDKKKGTLNFLITCKHSLDITNSVRLRFNTRNNASALAVLDLKNSGSKRNEIGSTDTNIDLVALYLDHLPPNVELRPIALTEILDEKKWRANEVDEGSDVFAVAPVYGRPGETRNFPAIRCGKIAQISPENWYNERDQKIYEKGILTDINLTVGTSGAPVFIAPKAGVATPTFLGVVKGAPDVPSGRVLPAGTIVKIPQSVSAFEPAGSVLALLRQVAKEMEQHGFALTEESRRWLKQ